jgi:hypothetical protein
MPDNDQLYVPVNAAPVPFILSMYYTAVVLYNRALQRRKERRGKEQASKQV